MGLRSQFLAAAAVAVACAPAAAFAEPLSNIVSFSIPTQSLDSALLEFSRQSGVQVIAPSNLLAGRTAPSVRRRTSGRDALTALLRTSNLTFEVTGDRTVSITRRDGGGEGAAGSGEGDGGGGPTPRTRAGVRTDAPQGRGLFNLGEGQLGQATVEQVVVTGSRIQVLGFQAPTPVTTVTAEQFASQAPGTVAEALSLLPSMRFSGPQDTRMGTQGGSGGVYLNLRGLTAVRTLTLLDGRRVVGGTSSGSVDANMLPTALLERVDVVTGGASAAYGSDAVAGVVNFILNKTFEGALFEAQAGGSTYGDNGEIKLGGAFGRTLSGGRGHLIASLEGYDSQGVDCRCSRPVERDSWSILLNPSYTATNGQTRRILVSNVRLSQSAYGGLIIGGPFAGLTFDSDGAARPFQFGSIVSGSQMAGGEGPRGADYTIQSAPSRRASTLVRGSWSASDAVTLYAEGMFSLTRIYFSNSPSDSSGASSLTIHADNPFLPTSLAQAMVAQGVPSIRVARSYSDLPTKDTFQRTWTQRYVAGANIDLGETWRGEAYVERGEARNSARVPHNLNLLNLYLAQDAVRDAAGRIVCRSSIANPGDGCAPFNALGSGRSSAAAQAYVLGESNALAVIEQTVVAASVSGQPFATGAGAVSVAFGAEYRTEGFRQRSDAVSQAINPFSGTVGGWRNANPQPQFGELTVREAFAELDAPLAAGLALARELKVNAAVRLTDYSTSGGITSWKLGTQWSPGGDALRLRATRSRDIRAPNINELFLGGTQLSFATVVDPFRNTTIGAVRQTTRGNPDLAPEIASTTTLGLVFAPSGAAGLKASIDFYAIDIGGAIASQTAQQTVDQCFAGAQDACKAAQRDISGQLISIDLYPRNLASLQTSGVDFELAFRLPSGAIFGLPGEVSAIGRGTYVDSLKETSPGAEAVDRAGDVRTGNQPRWRWNAQASWVLDPLTLNLQGRWVGGGRLDSGVPSNDIDVFEVDGRFYVDARLAYQLREGAEVYVSSSNLFNTTPPIPPNSTVYDSVGRMLRVGVRLRRG